jgi:hypothetical protein
VLLAALMVGLVGCGSGTYPIEPQGAEQGAPAGLGTPAQAVVLFLQPRPGDRIELLDAQAVGLPASVEATFFFDPPIPNAQGGKTIGDVLEPLAGATFGAPVNASVGSPDYTVGVTARLVARAPGTFVLRAVRLRFRVNNGPEFEKVGITVAFTICAADPRPTACDLAPSG